MESESLANLTPSARILAQFQLLNEVTEKSKDQINAQAKSISAQAKPSTVNAEQQAKVGQESEVGDSHAEAQDHALMQGLLTPLAGIAAALEFTQLLLRQAEEDGRFLAAYEAVVYLLAGGGGTPLGMGRQYLPRDLALLLATDQGAAVSKAALQRWIKGAKDLDNEDLAAFARALAESEDRSRQALLTLVYSCAIRSIKSASDAKHYGKMSLDQFVRSNAFADAFSQNAIAQFFTAIALQGQAMGDQQTLRGFYLAESAASRFSQAPGAMNLAARFRIELSRAPDQGNIPVLLASDVDSPREALLRGAVELASRAIQIDPDYPDYYWTRARAHSELGNSTASKPDFAMALYQAEAMNDIVRHEAIKTSWESYNQRMPLIESTRQVQSMQSQASLDRMQLVTATSKLNELSALSEELRATASNTKNMSEDLRHEVNAQMREQQREQFQVLAFLAAALALIVTGADAVQQASSDSYVPTLAIMLVWLLCLSVLLGTGILLIRRRSRKPSGDED